MAVIRILIDEDTEVGHFRDAIIMEESDFNEILEKPDPFQEIQDMAQERIDNFVDVVKNPPEPEED